MQSELSPEPGYIFLDEVQNVVGWEKFARRLADSGRRAYITGSNAAAKFVERQGSPAYYFSDNGLLSLFLRDKDPVLLENEVAVAMRDVYGDGLFFLKSPKTGIDIDFYVPDQGLAVQVAYSIHGEARRREVGGLAKLAAVQPDVRRLVIVTKQDQGQIDEEGVKIEVVPAWCFLLQLAEAQGARAAE